MMKSVSVVFAGLILLVTLGSPGFAQSISSGSGTVRGTVLDPTGSAIPGATVQIVNPVSSYNRTTQTDSHGNFEFDNIPYNNYHSVASAHGFQSSEQDLNIRSTVPVQLKIGLIVGAAST